MVQKSASQKWPGANPPSGKKRGRPRGYEPDAALTKARAAFWDAGYSATSLDALSAATGMNRPSLYGAFGDKRALYLKTLEGYRALGRAAIAEALGGDRPLRESLGRVYRSALAIYLSGEHGARGCFLIGTAAPEAIADKEVRDIYAAGLHELDDGFAVCFRRAQERGELAADVDPVERARLASAVLHTLSLRARAGEKREALERTAAQGIALLCGGASV
ncbi:MAG TPA: TetR/AcrR family transcriptional regulator [Stellaceae bacterium]|nr:TetR/AcrR family transcriptional regulator [Stellaceae bacterium]